ncbi:VanZ family protein [Olsenella profusa]|uniref:VanZ family protein n=1 Tax=Olsenella profusa TaxID=138595 RepID=A0ABS2EZ33_9ACTN|nr:VanZ family protein [Olsenella profusa]MBM6773979.1 VanZ family protein [Olsenella profusa]
MVRRDDRARRARWWAVALACWVAFIWCHSLVQGPQSSLESGMVVSLVRPLFETLGVTDADLMSFVVRKCAHFSEYAVLGVLSSGLLRARRRETGARPLPAGLAVALVPVVDECIQLGIPGRTGQPTDVLIDLSGLLAGALLATLVARLRSRRAPAG